MADNNITLKRVTGSGTSDNLYPRTTWTQVLDKPTTFTPTAHSHGNITDAGAIGSTANLAVVTTTSGVLTTRTLNDSSANASLVTASTALVTERDVAFGLVRVNNADQTRATTVYAPTTGGTAFNILLSNGATSAPSWTASTSTVTSASINNATDYTTTVTGFGWVRVALYTSATNKVYDTIIDLKDTNEFSTTTRTFRYVWNNGTSTFADNLQVQNVSGSLRLRHGSGVSMIMRLMRVY